MMPEITKSDAEGSKNYDRLIWVLLIVAGIAAYFSGLNLPLVGPDEPRYAQIAREMFERGDWVTPKLGGYDWFEKPALLYWLQIISYKIFGVSEFAARFGSALFGLGIVLALWLLGRAVQSAKCKVQSALDEIEEFNLKHQSSKGNSTFNLQPSSFASHLALIAASTLGLIAFSHAASFDIILTFPLTASLVGFFIYELRSKTSATIFNLPLLTFYFFIGVALIAKGLVGAIFPAAIVTFYYVLCWKLPPRSFLISLIWGLILTLFVAAIWYVPMYQANDWKFIDEFFIQHHFQRYTSNKYQHPQPFYFFFWVLPLMTLPWLPLFGAALWSFLKAQVSRFKTRLTTENDAYSALRTFAFAWMLVPLVFFSVSGSKLPGYVLPSLPAALILAADFAWQLTEKNRRWKILWQSAAFAVFAGTILTAGFFAASFVEPQTVKNLLEAADRRGYGQAKILNMHTVSHNAEFYGAGRVIRNEDGKIWQVYGAPEIVEQIKRNSGNPVLVIVPPEYIKQLTESHLVNAEIIAQNEENALAAVSLK